jgi:hypothetical protein
MQITAFGETKSTLKWSQDERCVVSYQVLCRRIKKGWNSSEAITTPTAERAAEISIKAFGETKLLSEWVADPRCVVSYHNLYTRVVQRGWKPEKAIEEPVGTPFPGRVARLLRAFGEEKTFKEWAADERCVVKEWKLRSRVAGGWNAEEAITTPGVARVNPQQ